MRRERGIALLLTVLVAGGPATAVAGQSAARLEVTGGGLSVSAPRDVDLPPARVNGSPVTVEAPAGELRVVDARGAGAGWTLVAEATPLTDARGVPLGAALSLVPGATGLPAGVSLGPVAPLDEPRALAEAFPGAGGGTWTLRPTVRLTVPADADSGTYSSTLVITIS